MEENKNNIEKLNNAAESLPEVPRDPEGKIIIDQISIGKDDKENIIIPDNIFNAYYKELPEGIINESRTKRTTSTGGYIGIFGGDPEADKEKQKKGREAQAAAYRQRKSFAEAVDTLLKQKASKQAINDLDLPENANNLDVIMASAIKQVQQGNIKAMEYLRDTAGEKPTEKIDASLSAMTPEQQKILEDIKAFNSNT